MNWSSKSKTVVRLGYYEDETAEKSDWNFPATHYLESWGDAVANDSAYGSHVPVQPLIQPLFGGLMELEFLARLAGESQTSAYEIVRATFGGDEESWKKFLFNGYQPYAILMPEIRPKISGNFPGGDFGGTLSKDHLEVIFYRDAKVDDGRYANNGWMQELPDPITKMTWDNAVLISRKTARELGVANGDVVEISLNGKTVSGPIWTLSLIHI